MSALRPEADIRAGVQHVHGRRTNERGRLIGGLFFIWHQRRSTHSLERSKQWRCHTRSQRAYCWVNCTRICWNIWAGSFIPPPLDPPVPPVVEPPFELVMRATKPPQPPETLSRSVSEIAASLFWL